MALFDDIDWGAIGKRAISSAAEAIPAAVVGAVSASRARKANTAAAEQANQARLQGIRAIQAGNDAARAEIVRFGDRMNVNAAPANAHLRDVIAVNPTALTDQQQIELADAQRTWNARMGANPSINGSGRGTVAMHNDLTNRTKARMLAENRARQDAAARTLAGTGNAAAGTVATSLANLNTQGAKATADGLADMGTTAANATTDTEAVNQSALSAISSVIASASERDRREQRYRDWSSTERA